MKLNISEIKNKFLFSKSKTENNENSEENNKSDKKRLKKFNKILIVLIIILLTILQLFSITNEKSDFKDFYVKEIRLFKNSNMICGDLKDICFFYSDYDENFLQKITNRKIKIDYKESNIDKIILN